MNIVKEKFKAFEFFKSNQLEKATLILNKILKKYPNDSQAMANLALIYIRQNKISSSLELFEKSLLIKYDISTINNLFNLYNQTNDLEKIISLYEEKLSNQDKLEVNFLIFYIQALRKQNKKNDCLKILKEKEKIFVKNFNYLIAYGYTLNFFNYPKQALSKYLIAYQLDPNNEIVNYNLGIVYGVLKENKKAIYYLERTTKINPNSFDSFITLCAYYTKERMYAEAYTSLETCKTIDPKNKLINFQLGTICIYKNELEKAIDYLRKVLDVDPDHIESNYHLGLIYLKKQDYAEAIKYYRFRIHRNLNKYGMFNDFNLPKLKKDQQIIVGWEQGIGDQIFLFRMMQNFSEIYENLTYVTEEKLHKILELNYPKIKFIKKDNFLQNTEKYINYIKLNLATLFHYVQDPLKKIKRNKFLMVNQTKKNIYEERYKNNNKKIIGISWKSINTTYAEDKSIKIEDFENLFMLYKDYKFICLQYGNVKDEINKIKDMFGIEIIYVDDLDYFNDIDSLAALISICDHVVTSSNITVHLSGSIGINTDVLIAKNFGRLWYWWEEKEFSSWYPTVRINLQEKDQEWKNTIRKINLF